MVVFICEACNESLKRAKVAQHRYSCRGCWTLSCMDCNLRFNGDDYLGGRETAGRALDLVDAALLAACSSWCSHVCASS